MLAPILRLLLSSLLLLPLLGFAQGGDSTGLERALSFPDRMLGILSGKASQASSRLDHQVDRYLSKLQRREGRLKRKLWKKDSLAAKALFPDLDQRYAKLKATTGQAGKYSPVYSGHLDSLATTLHFLSQGSRTANPEVQKTWDQYQALQQKLNASQQIKEQLEQRERTLKEGLEQLGMVKQLRAYQKQLYYYNDQLAQYKQALEDPSRLEEKLLAAVRELPQFREFFRNNSVLGSLFALPGAGAGSSAALQGLQTRAMVSQSITSRFGSSQQVTDQLRSNLAAGQGELGALKARVASLSQGSYGNSGGTDIPSFRPNHQKGRRFLQRLEVGANMQSQKARYFFPVTSDLGLSVGYKLNDRSSAGVGVSYKLGWGSGWDHIHITHQGVGLRSYVEYQVKGSFYFCGGYELNYRSAFKDIYQLRDYSGWQKSGLVGVSKRYAVSRKLKGEMKLLWDVLSYQQVPRTQAVLFRIGYNLK